MLLSSTTSTNSSRGTRRHSQASWESPCALSSCRFDRLWWELQLLSCLRCTAHIRTGDLMTWILGCFAQCKSRAMEIHDFEYPQIYRFHIFSVVWEVHALVTGHRSRSPLIHPSARPGSAVNQNPIFIVKISSISIKSQTGPHAIWHIAFINHLANPFHSNFLWHTLYALCLYLLQMF